MTEIGTHRWQRRIEDLHETESIFVHDVIVFCITDHKTLGRTDVIR